GARRNTRAVQNHIKRFAACQSDGVRVVVQVVSLLVAKQLGVVTDNLHRNSQGCQGLVLRNVQIGNAQQSLLSSRQGDDGGQWLREVARAIGGLSLHRAGSHRVRIAATIQQEVLVLHVRKTLRVESHAHKVE